VTVILIAHKGRLALDVGRIIMTGGNGKVDKDVETAIAKSFFVKRLQDRIMFELFSPKRRSDALHRLCHYYRTTLREEYLNEIPTPNSDPEEIAVFRKSKVQRNAADLCIGTANTEDYDDFTPDRACCNR
jgi:hypothetical protein